MGANCSRPPELGLIPCMTMRNLRSGISRRRLHRRNHFSRVNDAIEFGLRHKARLKRCRLEREIVVHRHVSDLGSLVVADDGSERSHQHQGAIDIFLDLLQIRLMIKRQRAPSRELEFGRR